MDEDESGANGFQLTANPVMDREGERERERERERRREIQLTGKFSKCCCRWRASWENRANRTSRAESGLAFDDREPRVAPFETISGGN